MSFRIVPLCIAIGCLAALLSISPAPAHATTAADGIVKLRSAHTLAETVERLRASVVAKGIMLFKVVEQSQLAETAGVKIRPSTLIVFGNPALGGQFLASNPYSGLDWPVRLLVVENDKGEVWVAYTDFAHIARRHGITDRESEFALAARVVASITSSVAVK